MYSATTCMAYASPIATTKGGTITVTRLRGRPHQASVPSVQSAASRIVATGRTTPRRLPKATHRISAPRPSAPGTTIASSRSSMCAVAVCRMAAPVTHTSSGAAASAIREP